MLYADAVERLTEAGLSEKEARVYVALLALGTEGVQEIAAKADVSRASTYAMLEALMARGLVTRYEEDRRTVYTAEAPKKLVELVEREAQSIHERREKLVFFVPELEALFQTQRSRPVVRFYEGDNGLRSFRDHLGRKKGERVDAFIRLDQRLAEIAAEDAARRMQLIHPNQRTRILYVPDSGVQTPAFPPHMRPPMHEVRFAEKLPFTFEGEVGIFDDAAYMAALTPNVMACVVESPAFVNLLRALFELAWANASQSRET